MSSCLCLLCLQNCQHQVELSPFFDWWIESASKHAMVFQVSHFSQRWALYFQRAYSLLLLYLCLRSLRKICQLASAHFQSDCWFFGVVPLPRRLTRYHAAPRKLLIKQRVLAVNFIWVNIRCSQTPQFDLPNLRRSRGPSTRISPVCLTLSCLVATKTSQFASHSLTSCKTRGGSLKT